MLKNLLSSLWRSPSPSAISSWSSTTTQENNCEPAPSPHTKPTKYDPMMLMILFFSPFFQLPSFRIRLRREPEGKGWMLCDVMMLPACWWVVCFGETVMWKMGMWRVWWSDEWIREWKMDGKSGKLGNYSNLIKNSFFSLLLPFYSFVLCLPLNFSPYFSFF